MVREIAGRLIRVKAGARRCVHQYPMSENLTFTNEVICPVCGRPMVLLHTIRRVFGDNLNVFKCKPCGFSTTEPVSWTTRPVARQAGGRN
jgi:C4-type Zn-finger protein